MAPWTPARRSGGDQRGGDEQIEVRDPWFEDRSVLAVEVDRQREDQALRDQIRPGW